MKMTRNSGSGKKRYPHILLPCLLFLVLQYIVKESVYGQNIENIKSAKPFSISGNLGFNAVFYHIEGRTANRKPFSWTLTGSPVISIYGISFPFSFTVSEQERNFNQPFNQYGVTPTYKWVKLHLGYSNLQFSPYSLGGHSIMGAGIELNPGKFRFGFIYGRLLRPVPFNDTVSIVPSFKRTGYSVKIGYGTAENFVDLILLRAKDFKGSIENVDQLEITPAENVVWSFVTSQKITKWLSFSGEFAQSVFTNDDRIDTMGANFKKESNFISNALIKTNSSTKRSNVIDGNIQLGSEKYKLGLHYKRIGADYQSMGAYYFQNNIRNITIEPAVKIYDNKLSLSGSLGFQTDNLDESADFRTNRTIGSVHATWQPSQKLQTDVMYSNYDMGQRNGIAVLDTLTRISQTTSNIVINQSLFLTSESMSNSFIVSFNYQKLNDHNSNTANNTEYTTNVLFASWYMTHLKSGLSTGLSFNYSNYDMTAVKTQYFGPSLSVSKGVLKQKMNLTLFCSGYKNKSNGEFISTIMQVGFRGSYRVAKKHRIQLKYSFNKSHAETSTVKSYTENKGEVSYVYSF
jgi:hypothetical protein